MLSGLLNLGGGSSSSEKSTKKSDEEKKKKVVPKINLLVVDAEKNHEYVYVRAR
jgi:hypothetical protein